MTAQGSKSVRPKLWGRSPGMMLLFAEKSAGAVFFLVATVVLLVLEIKGITHPIQSIFQAELREDPHDLLANLLIRLFPQVGRSTLLALGAVSSGYFVLHLVEAIGLWYERLWVEYLVLIETAALLPYEVYELGRHFGWFRLALLTVNVVIVGYLARRRTRGRASS